MQASKLPKILDYHQCPCCHEPESLKLISPHILTCYQCHHEFSLIQNIPILIDENQSVFSRQEIQKSNLLLEKNKQGIFQQTLAKLIPNLGTNRVAAKNYTKLREILLHQSQSIPKIFILGGGVIGEGIEQFLDDADLEIIETDVVIGKRTQLIVDAHQIPFQDNTFDCIIAQAVLEHVLDPFQCIQEIYRVLKPNGIIYIEIPFMQQVHGEAYDFTRFTRSGLRRLLRNFVELDSGLTGGPGTVMAWSYEYLLLSLFGYSSGLRLGIKAFARLTGFWLQYLDNLAQWNPRISDAASGLYFMGKKVENFYLTDSEIIDYYHQGKSING